MNRNKVDALYTIADLYRLVSLKLRTSFLKWYNIQ